MDSYTADLKTIPENIPDRSLYGWRPLQPQPQTSGQRKHRFINLTYHAALALKGRICHTWQIRPFSSKEASMQHFYAVNYLITLALFYPGAKDKPLIWKPLYLTEKLSAFFRDIRILYIHQMTT